MVLASGLNKHCGKGQKVQREFFSIFGELHSESALFLAEHIAVQLTTLDEILPKPGRLNQFGFFEAKSLNHECIQCIQCLKVLFFYHLNLEL